MLASSSGSSPWEVSDPSQEIREGGKEGGKGQGERKPFFVLLPLVAKSDLFVSFIGRFLVASGGPDL